MYVRNNWVAKSVSEHTFTCFRTGEKTKNCIHIQYSRFTCGHWILASIRSICPIARTHTHVYVFCELVDYCRRCKRCNRLFSKQLKSTTLKSFGRGWSHERRNDQATQLHTITHNTLYQYVILCVSYA